MYKTYHKDAFNKALLAWYDAHQRVLPWRESRDWYRVLVSEMMLQQTQVSTVKAYFARWMKLFPTACALAAAKEEAVLKAWEGLGYYRRAKNLHRTAKVLCEEGAPTTFLAWRKLFGVGDYTAAAVASIAFGEAVAAVDANLLRVFARLFAINDAINTNAGKKIVAEHANALIDTERPGDWNQALMDLGAGVCTAKNPQCARCPLQGFCLAYAEDAVAAYPVKKEKKARTTECRTLVFVSDGKRLLLSPRPQEGLLGGFLEPLNVLGTLTEEQAMERVQEKGFTPLTVYPLAPYEHVFTHKVWQLDAFLVVVKEKDDARWYAVDELLEQHAIAGAFRFHYDCAFTYLAP